jgi:hypothetical protein
MSSGGFKSNQLILQGHPGDDVVLQVQENQFTMSMGSDLLMTVAPSEESILDNVTAATNTSLTIAKDTTFEGSLTVNRKVVVNGINFESLATKSELSKEVSDLKAALAKTNETLNKLTLLFSSQQLKQKPKPK